jgi:hypothetical protein
MQREHVLKHALCATVLRTALKRCALQNKPPPFFPALLYQKFANGGGWGVVAHKLLRRHLFNKLLTDRGALALAGVWYLRCKYGI